MKDIKELRNYVEDQIDELNEIIDGLLFMVDSEFVPDKREELHNKLHDYLSQRNVYYEILDKIDGE